MRQDQYERLLDLEEKLTEQFLAEANPSNWSGDGILPKDLTKDERGDRYWCKKNAVATIALTIRLNSLVGMVRHRGEVTPPPGDGEAADPADTAAGLLDAEVAAAEKEARALMDRFEKRAKAGAG